MPLPASALTEGYEALRAFALEPHTRHAVPRGLGVLRGRGLTAWLVAVSSATPAVPPAGPPPGPTGGTAPCAPAKTPEIVHVLAAMVLSAANAQGMGP